VPFGLAFAPFSAAAGQLPEPPILPKFSGGWAAWGRSSLVCFSSSCFLAVDVFWGSKILDSRQLPGPPVCLTCRFPLRSS